MHVYCVQDFCVVVSAVLLWVLLGRQLPAFIFYLNKPAAVSDCHPVFSCCHLTSLLRPSEDILYS